MRALTFLILTFSAAVYADNQGPQSPSMTEVPIVSLNQFKVGNFWQWTYYEKGDASKIYSTERYQVVAAKGNQLTFEIWTKVHGRSEFTPSARFEMDYHRCYQAYRSIYKQSIPLIMYGYENGKWSDSGFAVGSVAFEEKFNCNYRFYTKITQHYLTKFDQVKSPWGELSLFQQWPRASASQLKSFYVLTAGPLQGISYRKTFNPQSPDFFEAILTDWKME
ncbi:MAG: hypothetical protein COT73_00845 [Bdellovibrio sp. CG10_big_fil_rev_8_21_14_0_10_47_8]|nr:MAG: hypothetical protein COT73_00845 [Bdellovibrio sp. CG10_big_fil_rev_8_21_14_0_10_47_8]